MPHFVKLPHDEIKVGSYISFKGIKELCQDREDLMQGLCVVDNQGDGIVVEVEIFNDQTGLWEGRHHYLPYTDYTHSILCSKPCTDYYSSTLEPEDIVDDWSECEKFYGINHLGNDDPDPVRELAFKILKGDNIALDMAKDILKL